MSVVWQKAPDVKKQINALFSCLKLPGYQKSVVFCYRSLGAQTRAVARIWGLNRLWQLALKVKPHYLIEVIGEKYDRLPPKSQERVLLHEIAHIPRNFSGSLIPHRRFGKSSFRNKVKALVNQVYENHTCSP